MNLGTELLSNTLSWAICIVIWFRIHDLVTDSYRFHKTRASLWAIFALALIANTALRIYDETYMFVSYGAIIVKSALLPALLLDAYVKDRRHGKST
jgi:hypothetical protein